MYCNIKNNNRKKQVETTAIVDTGNMLKDPITGVPVIVVESSLLEKNNTKRNFTKHRTNNRR